MPKLVVPAIPVMQGTQTAPEWLRFFQSLVRRSESAPVAQTVGVSPAAFKAPDDGAFYIVGGTVTGITLARAGWSSSIGANANPVPVQPGDTITVTYAVAPVVTFLKG